MNQKELAIEAYHIIRNALHEDMADINVTEIAQRLDVSTANLSRAFKKYYNRSLSDLIKSAKYYNFLSVLANRNTTTVKEILDILDIRSASHFIKGFKKWCGKTPGEMVREHHERLKQKENAKNE
jgi:AraC-like DNA-binding protein